MGSTWSARWATAPGLVEAARAAAAADVIVADLAMPGMSGLEARRRLMADALPAKTIFLTMHAEAQLAAQAFRDGAAGFVAKHAAGKELVTAMRRVLRGGMYLHTPRAWREVLVRLSHGRSAGAGPLTARQRDVLGLLAEGRP